MIEEELAKNATEWLKNNSEKPKEECGISLKEAGNAIRWALSHQWIKNEITNKPNQQQEVFIHTQNGFIGKAKYFNGAFYNNDGCVIIYVDYWMSIPEIPKP